jgi:hypothetical protein
MGREEKFFYFIVNSLPLWKSRNEYQEEVIEAQFTNLGKDSAENPYFEYLRGDELIVSLGLALVGKR